MKIILEFSHEEALQAEQAYRGPEYAIAVEDFRSSLRSKIKHRELSPEALAIAEEISADFYEIFGGLIHD